MPTARLVIFREADGSAPLVDWLDDLPRKARRKCQVRLERLASLGHGLRRPEADYLKDGIHELRTRHQRVNYRILYFFHGRETIVLSHGFSKQRLDVPPREIELARRRRRDFAADPAGHELDTR